MSEDAKDPPPPNNWHDAITVDWTDRETVRLILLLAYEYLESTGVKVTPEQILWQLKVRH